MSHSLEAQAQIAIHRQQVRTMPEGDLRALADSLVVQAHNQGAMLRAAMRRIAELEMQRALFDAHAAAASLQPRQGKLRAVLNALTRWRCRILQAALQGAA